MNASQMTQISQDRINQLRAEADRSRLVAHRSAHRARSSRWALAFPGISGRFSPSRIFGRSAA
ncbi:MAG: hypothetical protein ACC726_06445 [Chloroflexota bacterium]